MKWIGQHVYDYIANFRNTVIIDGVSISAVQTSAESFADNDTSLMTSAAIDDRINTAVTAEDLDLTTDSGTIAIDLDSETLTIAGGTGIDTSATSNTVTVGLSSTITTDTLTFTSDNANDPLITIKNTDDSGGGTDARLHLLNQRGTTAAAGQDGDTLGAINFQGFNDAGTPEEIQYGTIKTFIDDATDSQESGVMKFGVASHDGSNDYGLILTGGSQSNEVDATVGLGSNSVTTIAGTLTTGSTAALDNSGQVVVAAQPNITSLGTLTALEVTGDVTVTGDNITFQSANADDPLITIKNTSNAANDMARLNFVKDRTGGTAASGDNVAEIRFMSEDAGGNEQQYGVILSEIDVATHGQESGVTKLGVANHDGDNGYGLILTGGSVNDEVDVTIGLGTASVTTAAGDLSVTSNATVGGILTATKRKFTKTGNTDGTHDGDVVYFGGTEGLTAGAIYHYKSDGSWEAADADAAANCDGLLAVALGAASDDNGMLLRGMVTLDHDPGAVGDVLFLSTTAGDCSATAPSGTGDIIRVIGYCLDASNGQIWFNPDGTYVEVA
tara:strand:- start:841 stop:2514 length:1674 start_codon:yes stop_codon:yes gene_type:complete